jgi:hypothetical protein
MPAILERMTGEELLLLMVFQGDQLGNPIHAELDRRGAAWAGVLVRVRREAPRVERATRRPLAA